MSDPFIIEGPTTICFSGGRTSAYMLRRILDAHKDQLPKDVFVTFANTGVEREETLEFIAEIEVRWGVPIQWLEYRRAPFNPDYYQDGKQRSNEGLPEAIRTNFRSASRRGEPFWQLIRWSMDYQKHVKDAPPILPNPTMRLCTDQLKIKTQARWMKSQGFDEYTSVVGIRADEPSRIARSNARGDDEVYPLARAGISKPEILDYWKKSPFDLQLDPNSDEGNCTLCFMKSRGKVVSVMRDSKDFDDFWLWAEEKTGQTFRKDRSYTDLRRRIDAGLPIKGVDDEATGDCFCGDGS